MNKYRLIYFSVFLLSASVLCFEIVSTRITSVIFVNDYAFIILSLAILGLGSGGVFSLYRMKAIGSPSKIIFHLVLILSISFCVFIFSVIGLSITDPFLYFFLLFLPFFTGGILYAQIYKIYAERCFKLYACDLSGAATGSLASLGLLSVLGAPNSILFIALVVCGVSVSFLHAQIKIKYLFTISSILVLCMIIVVYNGKRTILGEVPIGYFSEKDFYYVYPDPTVRVPHDGKSLEYLWPVGLGAVQSSGYGEANVHRWCGGYQVYRFNGNVQHTNSILQELLLHHTNAIPFLCLQPSEKRKMLVIGPGGGKEYSLVYSEMWRR